MIFTYDDMFELVGKLYPDLDKRVMSGQITSVYGIPRAGIPFAVAIAYKLNIPLTQRPYEKTLVADDYIDTGETIVKYYDNLKVVIGMSEYTKEEGYDHYLLNKPIVDDDITFPWTDKIEKKKDGFKTLIRTYGESRELVVDKMVKYWSELLDGYGEVEFKYTDAWNDYLTTVHERDTCIDEDYLIPFTVWVTLEYKSKRQDLDSWSFRDGVRRYCHRLQTPNGLLKDLYNAFNKKFKYMKINIEVFHPVYGKMVLVKEEGEMK